MIKVDAQSVTFAFQKLFNPLDDIKYQPCAVDFEVALRDFVNDTF
jgi:hypothetical protein